MTASQENDLPAARPEENRPLRSPPSPPPGLFTGRRIRAAPRLFLFSALFAAAFFLSRGRIAAKGGDSFVESGAERGEFFVAPGGSDSSPGTEKAPFRTLEAARDAVRGLLSRGETPRKEITVWVRGGRYERRRSFLLEEEDSGRADAPVVYRAFPGEKVVLAGGIRLAPGLFAPLKDREVKRRIVDRAAREKVLWADLNSLGLAPFEPVRPRGFSHPVRPAPVELFFNGRPMLLARWPDLGFVETGKVIEGGAPPKGRGKAPFHPIFVYSGDRPRFWTKASDPWVYGYWRYDWADESIPVERIDPGKKEILLAAPHCYGLAAGKPYYAENLLEEISRPGEYYLDRKTGFLYFLPPGPLAGARIGLSLLKEPVVVLRKTAHVVFRGFLFEESRGDGVLAEDCREVRIEECRFRNLGDRAVVVRGGEKVSVAGCAIGAVGEGGISLSGGDRASLTPAGHEALNNDIHDFSRRVATYRPGVSLSGVGCRAAHNRIYDAPHAAVLFRGNDHVIEYNEIFDVLKRTGDGGAIYTGRDWTFRGNVIRYNYFHDLEGIGKWENAVYLDDQASGIAVFGNLFVRCHWGMLVGGGRDNGIENNLFVDCGRALHFDARGLGWAGRMKKTLVERLEAVPRFEEPWKSRFPRLAGILEDDPMAPKGNVVRRNILVRSGAICDGIAEAARAGSVIENNLSTKEDFGFAAAGRAPLKIAKAAGLWGKLPGFEPLPLGEFGLVEGSPERENRPGRNSR